MWRIGSVDDVGLDAGRSCLSYCAWEMVSVGKLVNLVIGDDTRATALLSPLPVVDVFFHELGYAPQDPYRPQLFRTNIDAT